METAIPAQLTDMLELGTLLITADQLAKWLQVSKRSLWRLRSAGEIPEPMRLGGAVRWRLTDVEAWMAKGCPRREST
jgi:excisionase family DNA binding protein